MTAVPSAPAPAASAGASRLHARLSLAGTVLVALLILALHGLKPEFEPSWRFLSEYAIGPHGWVMALAFELWAASAMLLAMALCHELPSRGGRIGRIVLVVVSLSLIVAGLFAQDPVTAGPEAQTLSGTLHAIASLIGVPGTPLAAMLISLGLVRHNPTWAIHRRPVMAAAHLTWISLALMVAYLGWAVPQAGGFTPEIWAGWMNRLVVTTYLLWQGMVAWRLSGWRG